MVSLDLTVTPEDNEEDSSKDSTKESNKEKPRNNDNDDSNNDSNDDSNDSNDNSNSNSNSSTGNSTENSIDDSKKTPENGDYMIKAELENAIRDYSEWAIQEYPQLHNIDLSDVSIEISDMKTQAGKVLSRKNGDDVTVRYSYRAYKEWGWEDFTETIRHELIHVWQVQRFGSGDHGRTFKRKAEALGCSVNCETFHEDYEYKLFCSECGDFVAGRHKMCKSVRKPEEFRSKCCKAALKSESV